MDRLLDIVRSNPPHILAIGLLVVVVLAALLVENVPHRRSHR